MKKPLCVALVEWCFWCLSAVFAIGALVLAVRRGAGDLGDLFVSACLVSAALLPAGMALGLRRGRRGLFEGPFVFVMGLLLAPCLSLVFSEWRNGGLVSSPPPLHYLLVLLMVLLVPIVLLRLPSSSRWFAFKSGGRKPRWGIGWHSLAFLTVILFAVVMSLTDSEAYRSAQVSRLALEARRIHVLQQRNAEARALDETWVDPALCTNAVDYVSRLIARFDTNAVFKISAPAPTWSIAVNVGAVQDLPDTVPVMVSANFDPAQIPQSWSGTHEPDASGLELRRVANLPACLGDQFALVVRRCGSVQSFKARYLHPRVVFGKEPWHLPAGMYWLTPTGRACPQSSGD